MENSSLVANSVAWGNPLILGLACLGFVPVLIHLWNRKNRDDVPFAAIEYLLGAANKHSRRIRLEDGLVLLMRVVAFLFFVAILADPVLIQGENLDDPNVTRPRTQHIIVIDNSFSMAAQNNGRSCLDEAKQFAIQRILSAPAGDKFSLIVSAGKDEVLILQPSYDRPALIKEIEQLEIGFRPFELANILGAVDDVLRSVSAARSSESVLVSIYSDLTQTSWGIVNESFAGFGEQQILPNVRFTLFDVGDQQGIPNRTLHFVEQPSGLSIAGKETELLVFGSHFSASPTSRAAVSLSLDGELIQQQEIAFDEQGQGVCRFRVVFPNAGNFRLSFRIESDRLPLDDQLDYSIQVRSQLNALLVGGRRESTALLELALAPTGTETDQSIQRVGEREWQNVDLSQFDLVILSNVARLTDSDAGRLQRFVREGGGLIVGLGDLVQPKSYVELTNDDSETGVSTWLGARIGSATEVEQTRFANPDYTHSALEPFQGFTDSGLLSAPTWRYHQLQVAEDSKVLLSYQTGDPAIVESIYGNGVVFLFAGSLSDDAVLDSRRQPWSGFAVWPSFLPMIQELAKAALKRNNADLNLEVGSPINRRIGQRLLTSATISLPDDSEEKLTLDSERNPILGSERFFRFKRTDSPGFYGLKVGQSETEWFAFRLPLSESDLSRVDVESIPAGISLGLQEEMQDSINPSSPPHRLYPLLIKILLGLLVVELGLAVLFREGAWYQSLAHRFKFKGRRRIAQEGSMNPARKSRRGIRGARQKPASRILSSTRSTSLQPIGAHPDLTQAEVSQANSGRLKTGLLDSVEKDELPSVENTKEVPGKSFRRGDEA